MATGPSVGLRPRTVAAGPAGMAVRPSREINLTKCIQVIAVLLRFEGKAPAASLSVYYNLLCQVPARLSQIMRVIKLQEV